MNVRRRGDSQLGGAIVVDPREGSPAHRVFVISTFGEPPAPDSPGEKSDILALNGSSWPHTEKLDYKIDDRVRWRIINVSSGPHAMHLHGFYFSIEATGDIGVERRQSRTVVTERMERASTFMMSWTPERAGNWLFHCHMTLHMNAAPEGAHTGHDADVNAAGMAGLVLGIQVTGPAGARYPMGAHPGDSRS